MSNFNAPDLSAPRFRSKVVNLLNKDLFNKFLDKHPGYRDKIDLKTFKSIVMNFNGNMRQSAIENRDGVQLPQSLGYIVIAKCDKARRSNIDYKASIKYGQYVTHRNWESDNYLAKICYSNYSLKYRFADRELWKFKPTKEFRQATSKAFPEMHQNYIHLTGDLKLSKLYKNS